MLFLAAAAAALAIATYRTECASCHGGIGQGSANAPALIGVSADKVHFMLDTGRMPAAVPWVQQPHQPAQLDEARIDALAQYVAGFSNRPDRALPMVLPGDADRGRQLYAENCEHCHGAGGEGGAIGDGVYRVAPSLAHATVFQVAEAIRAGPGAMPRFGPTVLSDGDVNDVARYVNVLQTQRRDPGGLSLADLGPVAEGLVAWTIGVGLLLALARGLGSR